MRKISFTRNLSVLRKIKGMTQEALAEACGVSRQAVTKWEAGSSLPDLYKLADIAETLDVTIDQLLFENDDSIMDEELKTQIHALEERASKLLERISVLENSENEKTDEDEPYSYNLEWDNNLIDVDGYCLAAMAEDKLDEDDYNCRTLFHEQALLRGHLASGFAAIRAIENLLSLKFDEMGPTEEFFSSAVFFMDVMVAYTWTMREMYTEIAQNPELGEDSLCGYYPKYEDLILERHRHGGEEDIEEVNEEFPFS